MASSLVFSNFFIKRHQKSLEYGTFRAFCQESEMKNTIVFGVDDFNTAQACLDGTPDRI